MFYCSLVAGVLFLLTMQSYDGFRPIPNFFQYFVLTCCDTETILRQTQGKPSESVAKCARRTSHIFKEINEARQDKGLFDILRNVLNIDVMVVSLGILQNIEKDTQTA